MYTPTTQWDRAPTDKELNAYYGKDKSTQVRDDMIEALTKTIRTVPMTQVGVEYVKTVVRGEGENRTYPSEIAMYPSKEVFCDYGTDKGPTLDAFIALIEKSDCPLVATWRMAVAKKFADHNADEVEDFKGDDE